MLLQLIDVLNVSGGFSEVFPLPLPCLSSGKMSLLKLGLAFLCSKIFFSAASAVMK